VIAEKPAAAATPDQGAPPPAASRPCGCEPCALTRLVLHDTRTPLHAIRGFGELLLTGAGGPLGTDALDYVQQVVRAARGLELALHHLQELATHGHAAPATAPVRPLDLGALLSAQGCRLSGPEIEDGAVPIAGDPASWRRVLQLVQVYLTGGEIGVELLAELARAGGGGLELTLRHPGGAVRDGTNLLAIELARRLAARDGARLNLAQPDRIVVVWPGA